MNKAKTTVNKTVRGAVAPARSGDVYDRADVLLDKLEQDAIDPATVRAAAQMLRVQTQHTKLELEHARATNRLQDGSPELPGFVRVAG